MVVKVLLIIEATLEVVLKVVLGVVVEINLVIEDLGDGLELVLLHMVIH